MAPIGYGMTLLIPVGDTVVMRIKLTLPQFVVMVASLLLALPSHETLPRSDMKQMEHWYDCNLLHTLFTLFRHRSACARIK